MDMLGYIIAGAIIWVVIGAAVGSLIGRAIRNGQTAPDEN